MESKEEEIPEFQERWEAQLRKGTLDMAALAVLGANDSTDWKSYDPSQAT